MTRNKICCLLILMVYLSIGFGGCAKESLPKTIYIPNKRIEMSPTMQQVIFNLVQARVKLKDKTKPIF